MWKGRNNFTNEDTNDYGDPNDLFLRLIKVVKAVRAGQLSGGVFAPRAAPLLQPPHHLVKLEIIQLDMIDVIDN